MLATARTVCAATRVKSGPAAGAGAAWAADASESGGGASEAAASRAGTRGGASGSATRAEIARPAARPSASRARAKNRLRNGDVARGIRGGLGRDDGQHAVDEVGGDGRRVDGRWQREGTRELAMAAL